VPGELHGRLSAAASSAVGEDYEIVLVNDGSRDRSWEMMRALAAQDPRLVAINLSRNHGHQLALTAGLDLCSGERILIIDADLQDPPELLPAMIVEMDERAAPTSSMRCAGAGGRDRVQARHRQALLPPACRASPRSRFRATPATSG
jgi:glycosyltransferase involved in cell wall biosynthesis